MSRGKKTRRPIYQRPTDPRSIQCRTSTEFKYRNWLSRMQLCWYVLLHRQLQLLHVNVTSTCYGTSSWAMPSTASLKDGPCIVDHTELHATHTFCVSMFYVPKSRATQASTSITRCLLVASHFTDPESIMYQGRQCCIWESEPSVLPPSQLLQLLVEHIIQCSWYGT